MIVKGGKTKSKNIRVTFRIENIVASASLGVELDLYMLAQEIIDADNVSDFEYEPEQFPGAILKLKKPKASLLVFKNGKVICTGTRSEKEVKAAIDETVKLLKEYTQ